MAHTLMDQSPLVAQSSYEKDEWAFRRENVKVVPKGRRMGGAFGRRRWSEFREGRAPRLKERWACGCTISIRASMNLCPYSQI